MVEKTSRKTFINCQINVIIIVTEIVMKGGDEMEGNTTMIRKSINYFHEHYDELTAEYGHKFLVIYDGKVIASYDNRVTALQEGSKMFLLGTFAVQETGVKRSPKIGPIVRRNVQ